jgi:hypothetical protein
MYSDMTVYTAPSGSTVLATGTMDWCWGLDSYPYKDRENPIAEQATRNILAKLVGQ